MSLFKKIPLLFLSIASVNVLAERVDTEGDDALRYFTLRVSTPDEKTLPDNAACNVNIIIKSPCFEDTYKIETFYIPNYRPYEKRFGIPERYIDPNSNYRVVMEMERGDAAFELFKGKLGTAHKMHNIGFRRIDVPHMKVKRQDGSSYAASGRTWIEYRVGDAWYPVCSFQTGRGIDVPSGYLYRVRVSADTGDGADSDTKFVDFRN